MRSATLAAAIKLHPDAIALGLTFVVICFAVRAANRLIRGWAMGVRSAAIPADAFAKPWTSVFIGYGLAVLPVRTRNWRGHNYVKRAKLLLNNTRRLSALVFRVWRNRTFPGRAIPHRSKCIALYKILFTKPFLVVPAAAKSAISEICRRFIIRVNSALVCFKIKELARTALVVWLAIRIKRLVWIIWIIWVKLRGHIVWVNALIPRKIPPAWRRARLDINSIGGPLAPGRSGVILAISVAFFRAAALSEQRVVLLALLLFAVDSPAFARQIIGQTRLFLPYLLLHELSLNLLAS